VIEKEFSDWKLIVFDFEAELDAPLNMRSFKRRNIPIVKKPKKIDENLKAP